MRYSAEWVVMLTIFREFLAIKERLCLVDQTLSCSGHVVLGLDHALELAYLDLRRQDID